jgi:hypothetical protein
MARAETVETGHSIKVMAKRYLQLAQEHDVLDLEWYAQRLINAIDEMEQNDWSGKEIKEQVLGRLSSIMP